MTKTELNRRKDDDKKIINVDRSQVKFYGEKKKMIDIVEKETEIEKIKHDGWKSRKWIAFFVAIAAVGVLTYFIRTNSTSLGIGCGAIVSLYISYVGGNVADKKNQLMGVIGKFLPKAPAK